MQIRSHIYMYILFDRVSGYRNVFTCFFFIVTFQHFTGHNDMCGSVAGSQASQNDQEGVVLLKLLNMVSVAPSNIQLDMLSSKC